MGLKVPEGVLKVARASQSQRVDPRPRLSGLEAVGQNGLRHRGRGRGLQTGSEGEITADTVTCLYGCSSGLVQSSSVSQLHSQCGPPVQGCHGDMCRVRARDEHPITSRHAQIYCKHTENVNGLLRKTNCRSHPHLWRRRS